MELHVVAVRNLKEKKLMLLQIITILIHFPLSLQSTTETKTCEEKLWISLFGKTSHILHIFLFCNFFLIFEMEILCKCSPAKNFWCSSLGGHSSLTFVMRWLLWSSFTVTKDGCRQLFVEHYPLGYVWGPQLIHLCLGVTSI